MYNPSGDKLHLPKLRKLDPNTVVTEIRALYRYYGDTLLYTRWEKLTVAELIKEIEDHKKYNYTDGKHLMWRGNING